MRTFLSSVNFKCFKTRPNLSHECWSSKRTNSVLPVY